MYYSTLNDILTRLSLILPLALGRAQTKMLSSRLNGGTQSCLDIGCGRGRFSQLKQFYSVGCDIHQPTLLEGRERGYYNDLVKCNVRQLPFKPKTFDTVISTELIEHLDKDSGLEFLRQAEQIACKQVIITTPWGFFTMEDTKDNPYNRHCSGWLPQEFQRVGYKTHPFYTFRFPKGAKVSNIIIKHILTVLLYPLVRLYPERFAMDFAAIKEIG